MPQPTRHPFAPTDRRARSRATDAATPQPSAAAVTAASACPPAAGPDGTAPALSGALRLAGARRLVAVGRLPASSPIAPAAGRVAGAVTPRVSPSGRRHAAATLVAGSTSAPVGAVAKGGA
jgi:hypothetical protein